MEGGDGEGEWEREMGRGRRGDVKREGGKESGKGEGERACSKEV